MENKFVIAIGFSAGGLSPLTTYFDSNPNDRAIYIILRHLPFEYQSELQHILQRHSKLKIVEARNNTLIEKDTIYMPPASMYMTIKADRLYLQPRAKQELFPNWTVDVFLESLAKEKGKLSMAIILSGTGSDGAKGSSLIKAAGGMVITQDINSCEHSSMPLNTNKTVNVDYQLLPSEMPGVVLQHVSAILKNEA